jgi:glucose-6-phosphate-specific signal transduction histidine kinase
MKIHSTAVLRRAKKIYWADETRQDLFICMAVGSIFGIMLGMAVSTAFFYLFIN